MQNPFSKYYIRHPLHIAVKNVYKDLERIHIKFSAQTLDHIADKAERVPHANKKNPIAFLIGFYITEHNQISSDRWNHVKSQLHKLDPPVKEEDVLRYAKLFIK